MTNKTEFGFDDQIYWILIQLVSTVQKSATLPSLSWTLHGKYSDFQLNCQLLLASHFIASVWATGQKTLPLPMNGYMTMTMTYEG